ncbi:oligosaccharide flippase family protein [Vibrio vulnificus]
MVNHKKKISIINITCLVIAFIQSVIVARLLGASIYGEVVVASSLIVFIQNVVGLRTGELVLRYYKKNSNKKYNVLSKIILIDIKMSIVLSFICLTFYFSFLGSFDVNNNYYLFFLLIIPSMICSLVFESLLICENEIYQFTKVKLFHHLIGIFLCVALIYNFHVYGYIASLVISNFLKLIVLIFITYKDFLSKGIFAGNDIRLDGFKKFTLNSYLSSSFKSGVSNLDVIILSGIVSSDKVAIYKVAKNLSAIPGGFMGSVWNAAHSKILEFSENRQYKELNKLTNSYTRLFFYMSLLFIPSAYFISEFMIKLIYGESYRDAYIPFMILMGGNFFAYAMAPFNKIFYIAHDKMEKMMLLNAFNFFFILILGYFWCDNTTSMAIIVSSALSLVSLYSKIEVLNKERYYLG